MLKYFFTGKKIKKEDFFMDSSSIQTGSKRIIPENKLLELISPQEISEKVTNLANRLKADYTEKGKEILILTIMKGAFIFAADLMRAIHESSVVFDYISCKSYEGKTSGKLEIQRLNGLDLKGKHVVLVDDIFDTGKTLNEVAKTIRATKEVASLATVVLLKKLDVDRKASIPDPDYVVFHVKNVFVVGYGLDCDQMYRGLPGIYQVPSN
jgi:hypoxanthine phosphoribosyltransferase